MSASPRQVGDASRGFLENGQKLLSIKDDLGHGHFGPWLAAKFHWSIRTAQNYMAVAARLSEDYHAVSYLPSQTIYRLVVKGTPGKIVEKVIAAKNGKPLTDDQVKGAIDKAKPEKLPPAPTQIGSEPATSKVEATEPQSRRDAAVELVQLIAPGRLGDFMRLAPLVRHENGHGTEIG